MCGGGNFLKLETNNNLIEFCKKWESLGVRTLLLKMNGQIGSKKLIKGYDANNKLSDGPNFIAILIRETDLICLDIDPVTPYSIPNFYSFLEDRGINTNSLLMEKTLNGGLHIYFRLNGRKIKNTHFLEHNGIHFDILTNFRVFTSPSNFRDKKYEWMGEGIMSINSFEDIPEIPEFVFEMLAINSSNTST